MVPRHVQWRNHVKSTGTGSCHGVLAGCALATALMLCMLLGWMGKLDAFQLTLTNGADDIACTARGQPVVVADKIGRAAWTCIEP
eukprot:6247020-Amphidinium_carterae.1